MHKLKHLSVDKQVLFVFGTLCAILLVIGGLYFFSLRAIERSNQRQMLALKISAGINDAAQDIERIQAGVLRQLLASDTGEIRLLDQTVRDIEKENANDLADHQNFAETQKDRQLYDAVMQARKAYWEQTQPVLALGLLNRDAEATKLIITKQSPAYNACLKAVNALANHVETSSDEMAAKTTRFISRLRIIGNALAGVAICIVIAAGFTVAGIARRLKEDNRVLQIEVAERKRAEETLRESDEKFRQLAANISDVFYMTSPDMQQTHYVSPAYEQIWGRPAANLYAHPQEWAEAILPEDRERVWATFSRLGAGEPNASAEFRITRPDGEVRWILSRGFQVLDAGGKLIRITGIATDITGRKAAEAATRELGDRLTSTLESLTDGFFTLDREWRFTYVNRAAEQLFRLSRAELLGNHIWSKFPEAQGTISSEQYERAMRDNVAVQFETFYAPLAMWFDARAFPSKEGLAVYFRDITERKQSEAALEKAHQELVAASRQAGMAEVATGVLHNVGNVLNSVNVASSCLADSLRRSKSANLTKVVALLHEHEKDLGDFLTRDPKGSQVQAYLAQLAGHLAGEQADALKELAQLQKNVEHIKDIVSMQQGLAKTCDVTEIVNVADLVEDALKMNISALARHDIQVIKEFEDAPLVTVDKHKALQILVNLLRNAKQACEGLPNHDRKLTIRTTKVGDHVRIAVCDNGVGIPPESLPRIFEHGFTTKKDGHGFGLHSAAIAAKEMGGALYVQSDGPGKGASFTLELPGVVN
jgi:PAS domain S-box-containing protein